MRVSFLALIALILFSCNSKKDNDLNSDLPNSGKPNAWISGQIQNANEVPLKLIAQSDKGELTLAQGRTEKDGKFKLDVPIKGLGIYQLQFDNSNSKVLVFPLNVGDKVKVFGNYGNLEVSPKFEGTKWASLTTEFYKHYNDFANSQAPLMNDNSLSDDQKLQEMIKLKEPLDNFVRQAMTKDPSNEANLLYSSVLAPSMGFEFWDTTNLEPLHLMANAYLKAYPDSPFGTAVNKQYEAVLDGYHQYLEFNKNGGKPSGIAEKAPEIALPDPNGQVRKLSNLRGHYVLVDFWASWCPPCRRENPNVVAAYKKYHAKGFEIYSVSLDKDPIAWKNAITKDNLTWKNHVSDLKEWESSVIPLYGIQSIPYSLLLDPKGNVIATNLRGESLERKLNEIYK